MFLLNNQDEKNLYLLCYRLCKMGQEWWQKPHTLKLKQPFHRNDNHRFSKGGKGNRDGFQALSHKCSTDPSPASWQRLFLFLLPIYLTDIFYFSLMLFSLAAILKILKERRTFPLSSDWNIPEPGSTQFILSLPTCCLMALRIYHCAGSEAEPELVLPHLPAQLALSVPIHFCMGI